MGEDKERGTFSSHKWNAAWERLMWTISTTFMREKTEGDQDRQIDRERDRERGTER